jgi:acyl-CoA hydrolase
MDDRAIYSKRGHIFRISDYPTATQELIQARLRPLEEIIAGLPRRFALFSALALAAPRAFLRKLSTRDDWEEIQLYCVLSIEPYPILSDPRVKLTNGYFSRLDRVVCDRMGKTVTHVPRQFIQLGETLQIREPMDYCALTTTPPDRDGFLNLGVNCETLPDALAAFRKRGNTKIIVEINSHRPWVQGHPDFGDNKLHLTDVDYLYENHEPMPQLPAAVPSDIERKIGEHVLRYIDDGDTLQFGIGGVPEAVASLLSARRDLKIHTELMTDAIADLDRAGAINSQGKALHDGYIIATFAMGTDKLYDWLHHNPHVRLLPIRQTNDPCVIARNRSMKSVNTTLLVDLHGQICSDAVGFRQVSGIGGQLEFVTGSQLSPGGRSIICLKSTTEVKKRRRSNIVVTLPPGTPVTVSRHFADVIITEYGAAELKNLDSLERARALVAIAHPDFRDELVRQAAAVGLWERRPGFDSFAKRALYNNLMYVVKLTNKLKKRPGERRQILFEEVRRLLRAPDLPRRLQEFYQQNRR